MASVGQLHQTLRRTVYSIQKSAMHLVIMQQTLLCSDRCRSREEVGGKYQGVADRFLRHVMKRKGFENIMDIGQKVGRAR